MTKLMMFHDAIGAHVTEVVGVINNVQAVPLAHDTHSAPTGGPYPVEWKEGLDGAELQTPLRKRQRAACEQGVKPLRHSAVEKQLAQDERSGRIHQFIHGGAAPF
jgi:hypothetical protein